MSATSTPQVVGSAQPGREVRKLTAIAGIGVTAVPFSAIADSGKVPGMLPEAVVDEQAADVVLLRQRRDDLGASALSPLGR